MPGKKGQNGRVYNRTVGMVKYAAVVLPFNSKATNLRHLLVVTPPPPLMLDSSLCSCKCIPLHLHMYVNI